MRVCTRTSKWGWKQGKKAQFKKSGREEKRERVNETLYCRKRRRERTRLFRWLIWYLLLSFSKGKKRRRGYTAPTEREKEIKESRKAKLW